jgi:hypothetical protein
MIGSRDLEEWEELLLEEKVGAGGHVYLETRSVMGNIRNASWRVSPLKRLGPN